MSRPTIIPVDLGGSPTQCWRRPPRRGLPGPGLVTALIEHYRTERTIRGPLQVAFFHGGTPGDELLAVCEGLPVRVSCSPADLTRSEADRLWAGGVRTIELSVGTLDERVLRTCQIGVRGAVIPVMLDELRAIGFSTGVVLSPGLPDSDHQSAIADARSLADRSRVDFVRIEPALAFEGTRLAALARAGRWEPMSLAEAVTSTLHMVEILEEAGVEIARLGLQPGQDIPVRAIAGPVHPNLRQLVEVRRFYARMAHELALVPRGSAVELQVNPRDLSWAKGTANANVRSLRVEHALTALRICPDESIPRGDVRLSRVG